MWPAAVSQSTRLLSTALALQEACRISSRYVQQTHSYLAGVCMQTAHPGEQSAICRVSLPITLQPPSQLRAAPCDDACPDADRAPSCRAEPRSGIVAQPCQRRALCRAVANTSTGKRKRTADSLATVACSGPPAADVQAHKNLHELLAQTDAPAASGYPLRPAACQSRVRPSRLAANTGRGATRAFGVWTGSAGALLKVRRKAGLVAGDPCPSRHADRTSTVTQGPSVLLPCTGLPCLPSRRRCWWHSKTFIIYTVIILPCRTVHTCWHRWPLRRRCWWHVSGATSGWWCSCFAAPPSTPTCGTG